MVTNGIQNESIQPLHIDYKGITATYYLLCYYCQSTGIGRLKMSTYG